MRQQWAYTVTVCDRKGRVTYTGKYVTYARAEAKARRELDDTPNGTASIISRFDGTCITLVADAYRETRDLSGFAI